MRKMRFLLGLVFLGLALGALTQLGRELMNNAVLAVVALSCASLAVACWVWARK